MIIIRASEKIVRYTYIILFTILCTALTLLAIPVILTTLGLIYFCINCIDRLEGKHNGSNFKKL